MDSNGFLRNSQMTLVSMQLLSLYSKICEKENLLERKKIPQKAFPQGLHCTLLHSNRERGTKLSDQFRAKALQFPIN